MKQHERYRIEGDTYAFGTDDIGLRMALAFGVPITETYIANKVFDDEICAEEDWLFDWELLGHIYLYIPPWSELPFSRRL